MLTLCSNVFVIYFEAIYHFHKENSIQIFTRVLNTHLVLCESPGRNVKPRHVSPNFKCHISPNFMIKKFHEVQQSPLVSGSFYYLQATHLFQNAVFILIQKFTNMTKLSVATLKTLNSFGINNLGDSN